MRSLRIPRGLRLVLVPALALLAMPAVARAQGANMDIGPFAKDMYPMPAIYRPLTLPANMVQVTAEGIFSKVSGTPFTEGLGVSLQYGLSDRVELDFGESPLLGADAIGPLGTLSTTTQGTTFQLHPNAAWSKLLNPGISILAVDTPALDIAPTVVGAFDLEAQPRTIALVGGLPLRLRLTDVLYVIGGQDLVTYQVRPKGDASLNAIGGIGLQIAPRVALQGMTQFAHIKLYTASSSTGTPTDANTYIGKDYLDLGILALLAVSPRTDLLGGITDSDLKHAGNHYWLVAGLSFRM